MATDLTLKLFIDPERQKVIFGEGDQKTIDFLDSIFSLPFGNIISLLNMQEGVKNMGNRFESLKNMTQAKLIALLGQSKPMTVTEPAIVESTMKNATYIVLDNLTVETKTTENCLAQGKKLKRGSRIEVKVVTLNIKKGLKILKTSQKSSTVLSDVFLRA